jgi:hypothetical protein
MCLFGFMFFHQSFSFTVCSWADNKKHVQITLIFYSVGHFSSTKHTSPWLDVNHLRSQRSTSGVDVGYRSEIIRWWLELVRASRSPRIVLWRPLLQCSQFWEGNRFKIGPLYLDQSESCAITFVWHKGDIWKAYIIKSWLRFHDSNGASDWFSGHRTYWHEIKCRSSNYVSVCIDELRIHTFNLGLGTLEIYGSIMCPRG